MLTHSELISFAWYNIKQEFDDGWDPSSEAIFESNSAGTIEVPDILIFGHNIDSCTVIECKASRSDFLADRKKPFRIYPEMGMGKRRVFVVNEGVVRDPGEIPEGWMCYVVIDEDTYVRYKHPLNDIKRYRSNDPTADRRYYDDYTFTLRNWEAEYRNYREAAYWRYARGRDRMEPMKLERESEGLPTMLDYDEYMSLLHERQYGRPMRK